MPSTIPLRATRSLLVVAASLLVATDAGGRQRSEVESFYTTSTSDRIVHVERSGSGVTVRVIENHFHDEECWQRIVRAFDVTLPWTSPASLAGVPVCEVTEDRFARAIKQARATQPRTRDGIPSGSSFETVVATCNGRERRFFIDYAHPNLHVDEAVLRQQDRDVHAIFTLGDRVAGRVEASAPGADAQETLGTLAAADMMAGKFDAAYRGVCRDDRNQPADCVPTYWTQNMGGKYTGPPPRPRGPRAPLLVEEAAWRFVSYAPPIYPPIAVAARIQGDVQVRLHVDGTAGNVTLAEISRGIPLLNDAAVTAARQWRFVPNSTPVEPFEVTLRFELTCPPR